MTNLLSPKPLFSIITVTLNNLKGLKKTHHSLQGQMSQNFEWIIIDGASNDSTIEFLNTHNLPYLSEKDNGIYDAMNKGLTRVNGQYVIFLNAGDRLADEHTLDKITQNTDTKHFDFIYGDSLEENKGGKTYKRARSHTHINQGMFTHHQAMIYNASRIKDIRYNKDFTIAADYDFTLRALQDNPHTLYINEPLCIFEAGGISQQQVLKGRKEQFKIRQAHGFSFHKNFRTFITQGLAYRLRLVFPKLYWFLKRQRD